MFNFTLSFWQPLLQAVDYNVSKILKLFSANSRKARTFGTVPTFDHNRCNADLLLRELHLHEVNFLIVKIFPFVVKRKFVFFFLQFHHLLTIIIQLFMNFTLKFRLKIGNIPIIASVWLFTQVTPNKEPSKKRNFVYLTQSRQNGK